jgi:thiamine biosynthesis lipoprotein
MRRVLLPHEFSEPRVPAAGLIREFHGLSMGTTWSVRVVEHGRVTSHLQQGLQQQLDRVVAQMSHWQDDSDLGRFNRAAAGTWHCLPEPFFGVLFFADSVARASGNACDPASGALVNRWGFGPAPRYDAAGFIAPAPSEVQALLEARHSQQLRLDHSARSAFQPGGMLLDLSAVAKGYGVDCLARYLDAQGMQHYLVEVGGELRGAGVKPDGQPWWVLLEEPADAATPGAATHEQAGADISPSGGDDTASIMVALHGLSIATSGDYRRFFTDGQRRFSHTIDPRTGSPVANDVASVTVVHAECMAADAWSTALTVLGPAEGMALADQHGIAARFLVREETGGTGLREYASTEFLRMQE